MRATGKRNKRGASGAASKAWDVEQRTPEGFVGKGADREEGELDERRVWQGEDGTIHWTLEETEEGDVQVALETQDDSLAGCIIAFSLVELDSRRVHYSRQLQLEPAKTPGKWEGWCSIGSRTEFPGPYELQLETLLAEETE